MNWKAKIIWGLILACGMPLTPFAQKPAACPISGQVLDSSNATPMAYASLSVLQSAGDSLVGGGLTNEKGSFEIPNLLPGSYFVEISFIGFRKKRIGPIVLTLQAPQKNLGRISLAPTDYQLADVQITDRQDLMLNNIDRKTYNVEKSLVSEGGAATDILRTLPSVEVDIDGNLSLRGSGNVTVLIDGKPSALTGAGRSAILAQIPASSIKSVEVITNPSARYDPDGMSGIINIITKKNKSAGLNGNLTLGVGTHQKYNSSLSLGYRTKKFNAYGTYSFRLEDRWGRGYSNSDTPADTASPILLIDNIGNRQTLDNMARLGIDFYLSERTTLGLAGGWAGQAEDAFDISFFQEQNSNENPVSAYLRPNTGIESMSNFDGEINLQQKFKQQRRSLDARLAYSKGLNIEDNRFRTQYILDPFSTTPSPEDVQRNLQTDGIALGTAQIDYIHPINDKNQVDAGAKATSRDIGNEFYSESLNHSLEQIFPDTFLNNNFLYKERIFAAYGIWGHSFSPKFASQVGLRAEQALTRSELVTTQDTFTNNYFKLFPNAYLSYKPKTGSEFRLSYSRRINRPTTDQLNPFTDFSNPKRLRVGNPELLPETIDAFELSYSKKFEKGSLSGTGYFRYITNGHTRYFTPTSPTSDSVIITFVNLLDGQSYGLEVIAQLKPAKWMDLMTSANFFRTVTDASNLEADLTVSNVGLTSNLNATVYFSKNTNLQVTANYSSPRVGPQGVFAAGFASDVAVKQNILKGKGSINLRVSDIFNTRRFLIFSDTELITGENRRKRESRIAYFTFSYRFGSGDATPKRKRQEERQGGEFDF
jgi:iron complex outermembrane receptor protein